MAKPRKGGGGGMESFYLDDDGKEQDAELPKRRLYASARAISEKVKARTLAPEAGQAAITPRRSASAGSATHLKGR
jgi:hypothetical protein